MESGATDRDRHHKAVLSLSLPTRTHGSNFRFLSPVTESAPIALAHTFIVVHVAVGPKPWMEFCGSLNSGVDNNRNELASS